MAELLGVYGYAVGDGIWASYVWDAENRLIRVEPPTAKTLAAGDVKVEFKYDYAGRRAESAWRWTWRAALRLAT